MIFKRAGLAFLGRPRCSTWRSTRAAVGGAAGACRLDKVEPNRTYRRQLPRRSDDYLGRTGPNPDYRQLDTMTDSGSRSKPCSASVSVSASAAPQAGQCTKIKHYDPFCTRDIVSERLATLYRLPGLRGGIVIASVTTLMQRLPPRSFLEGQTLRSSCARTHAGAMAFAHAQATFADAVNVAAFFLTKSFTLSGARPVSVRTSSDIRPYRPARCRSAIVATWFTT